MKRRWLMITMLVGALAVGAIGAGAVLAGGNGGGEGGSRINDLASRVATILGLDQAQVQDAFDQAISEIREERLQEKLDSLVASGKITEQQVQELETGSGPGPKVCRRSFSAGSKAAVFTAGTSGGCTA